MVDVTVTITRLPLFSGLAREDLARIAGQFEQQRFAAGEIIVSQGGAGDALYVVHAGAVEVVLEHDGARGDRVAVLGPCECFGEMAIFGEEKRSATVRAIVDSAVLKLRRDAWEALLTKHPALSLHVCNVLSRRLAETNRDLAKERGTLTRTTEEVFAAQPLDVQDLLLRTSLLRSLDLNAVQTVLGVSRAAESIARSSLDHPAFLLIGKTGQYQYSDHFRDFLRSKLRQQMPETEGAALHRRFATYFAGRQQWTDALYHYLHGAAWKEALELLRQHGADLQQELPKEVLGWLDLLPPEMFRAHGYLVRLRAAAQVALGDLGAAIRSYQDYLSNKHAYAAEPRETAEYYKELAELHRRNGTTFDALSCLQQGLDLLQEGKTDIDVVPAMQSIGDLEQKRGSHAAALESARRALNVVQKFETQRKTRTARHYKKWVAVILALAVGGTLAQIPLPPLDVHGSRFLGSLTAAIILWMFDVFDEYAVALALLLVWLVFGLVPPEMALAGFSKSSWFFALGVLGIAAAIMKSGLLYRLAIQLVRKIPPGYKRYTFLLAASGILVTPLMPKNQGRLAVMAPVSLALSEIMRFKPRSNGSAGLTLSVFIGYGQMSFMFLTGANVCLVGWSLLPVSSRMQFGWGEWVLAALPAGVFTLFSLLAAIYLLFPLRDQKTVDVSAKTLDTQLAILGPLTRSEWLSIAVLALALLGWLGKPLHGINEAAVALGAFVIFLISGVLDKKGLKNNIDFGYMLFLGVVSSLAVLMPLMKVDKLTMELIRPVVSTFSFHPLAFLLAVTVLVYVVRFFLNKTPAMILLMLGLIPWAQEIGIHPGILLFTILMAIESWFLPYQTDSYQIVYYSTDEKAFSHQQARKLMVAKFLVSLLAPVVSFPYWKMLGLIR